MPKLRPQSRAAIDQIEPEVLVAGQTSVVAPTLAGDRRRAVQSISEGATAIALEIANVVAELGGTNRLTPGVETALFEADSLTFDRPIDTRNRNFQIADALARAFGSLAAQILEGELHVDLLPMEVPTNAPTMTRKWGMSLTVGSNDINNPYQLRIGQFAHTDTDKGVTYFRLPEITPESAGAEVAVINMSTGVTNTIRVERAGSDTIDGVAVNFNILSNLQIAVMISDGVSNWMKRLVI